jgi:hypothetical protein
MGRRRRPPAAATTFLSSPSAPQPLPPPPLHRHQPAAAAAHAGTASEEEEILQSIVKVFTVSSSPNFFMPWQNKTQSEKTGSGVVALLPLPDVPNGIGRVALTPGCQVGYTHTGCHQLLLSTIRLTSLLHSLPGVRLVHTGSLQLADLLVF